MNALNRPSVGKALLLAAQTDRTHRTRHPLARRTPWCPGVRSKRDRPDDGLEQELDE
jgi:hypothetical protein